MKIRLLSDIHQEFYEDKTLYQSKGEDVLVLAGDIHVGFDKTWAAIKQFYEHQQNIIYVPGNHEYYRTSIDQFDHYMKRFTAGTGVKFLNPSSVRIGDVTFIGACGWTNFRKDRIARLACARNISDFSRIQGIDTEKIALLSESHFRDIFDMYATTEGKKVIITHFLPAIECISEQYRGPDLLNYYFANDYGTQIADMKDTTWLFGHTHDNVDIMLGDTRVVANPYGYNENKSYREMIITL